jgi:hypothetical protein
LCWQLAVLYNILSQQGLKIMSLINKEYHCEARTIYCIPSFLCINCTEAQSIWCIAGQTQYFLLFLFPVPFEPIEGDAFSSEFPQDAAGCYYMLCVR